MKQATFNLDDPCKETARRSTPNYRRINQGKLGKWGKAND